VGRGPGSTIFDPIHNAVKGIPQALTWYIGTIGSTVSLCEIAQVSAIANIALCR
jgi:hypothetical protein